MSNSEILLKAALNRLAARLEKKIINSAADFSQSVEEAPTRIKQEWETFKAEVLNESEKIKQEEISFNSDKSTKKSSNSKTYIEKQIDQLRSKIIELNEKVEEKN